MSISVLIQLLSMILALLGIVCQLTNHKTAALTAWIAAYMLTNLANVAKSGKTLVK